jgi:outer membrane protein OmpA-like peptidoglycan-associated protein
MRKNYMPSTSASLALIMVTAVTVGFSQSDLPVINVAKNINTSVHAEALNYLVNTVYNELGPMPTKDGKRLYFSRAGFPGNTGGAEDEDIWYSEYDEATQLWTDARNVGPPLNNAGANFITGVGRNGDTLLLANVYRKNGKMIAGVSVSIKSGDSWSFPVPVNIEADYNIARRATYDVSYDRKAMVISQHKLDTHGNLDLYVAFRTEDRKHPYSGTESINLGTVINTPADEISPWLSYDGVTLYFASDGQDGYGRMDIFKSIRLDDTWTNWSTPTNLGPGINSRYDEVSFNYNPRSRYAYFARGLSVQNSDIFRIDMTHLFLDKEKASLALQPTEKPAEIGETKVVENVFSGDQPTINGVAEVELKAMVTYLQKYKTMEVLVGAHSQPHNSREASQALSTERAEKVVAYLVKNGIEKKRLSFEGYGHDIVINLKTTDALQSEMTALASSVEFKIVGYIN